MLFLCLLHVFKYSTFVHYGVLVIFRLSANDYENIADETLDSLTEMFEDIPEKYDCDEEYDVTYNVRLSVIAVHILCF